MPRDVKPVIERAPMTHLHLVSATPSAQGSSIQRAPVVLFDPYSEQMIAYTHTGAASGSPGLSQLPAAASGVPMAVRVLQIALLSSVGVLIWLMLSLLQTTG